MDAGFKGCEHHSLTEGLPRVTTLHERITDFTFVHIMFSSDLFNPKSLSLSTFPPWLLISASQPAPPPAEMDRLRDLATRRRVDFHLRIPKSLSTTSLMPHKATDGDDGDDTNSAVSSTSASAVLESTTCLTGNSHPAMPSLHLDKPPVHSLPSSDTKITQSQSKAGNGMPFETSPQTSSIKKHDKKPKMKGKTKGRTTLKGSEPLVAHGEADQRLFDAAQAVIAQDNVIANSGLEVSRRMNECARDVLEANQIIKRKEHEIAAISTKIDSIKANFENASKHLQKAQAIAAEAIDNSVSEQFRRKEEANLVNILMGMTDAIAKGNSHNWSRAKVNKSLGVRLLCYVYIAMTQTLRSIGPLVSIE